MQDGVKMMANKKKLHQGVDYARGTEDWQDGWLENYNDDNYDIYGLGIDDGNEDGLDSVEYGGYSVNDSRDDAPEYDTDIENGRDFDGYLEDVQEDYNFGYGGNRHNRDSGSRFYELGRWRKRE